MAKRSALYQERLTRFNTAVAGGTPDRVPVFPVIEQWAQNYVGVSVRDSYLKDPKLEYEVFKKVYEDIYVDISYGTGNLIPLKMMEQFGEGLYVVSDTGVQIKGSHGMVMEAEEYPELIADPQKFIMEKIIPRKYPVMGKDKKTAVDTWMKGISAMIGWIRYESKAKEMIERNLDVPVVARGATFLPPDMLLDFLRDFVGVSRDVRKCPELFAEACDALFPYSLKMAEYSLSSNFDKYLVWIPLHLPTYLRPKDFEKLYFPSMKRMAEALRSSGRRCLFYCEGNWDKIRDSLLELPDGGGIYVQLESGDLAGAKKLLGNKVCLGGGMPVDLLRSGTKQQCIDQAKWCLDNLAPGGGYVFTLDKNLLSANDVNPENLAAVCEYVHENGKY